MRSHKKNDVTYYDVDVIVTVSGGYLSSFKMDFVPDQIREGYVYRIKRGKDIFPVVEKYRLDLVVYGK
ncbi:hypothetical protein ACFL7D_07345 [candidate division KSB1 bacterium]